MKSTPTSQLIPTRAFEAVRGARSFAELADNLTAINAQKIPQPFSILDAAYPVEAYDFHIPDGSDSQRFFVHANFTEAEQEEGEKLLDQSGLAYFPAIDKGAAFTLRALPAAARRLDYYRTTSRTISRIGRFFLAPVLRKLYEESGRVPSRVTMQNLVHTASANRSDRGSYSEVYFLPPYQFQAASAEQFAALAKDNAVGYGPDIQASLAAALQ